MNAVGQKHVAILMCTYNGAKYLKAQLESILRQTHTDWSLWVSDDGSTDETPFILEEFSRSTIQPFFLVQGPRRGAIANFVSLIQREDIEADYFSFCDQDDVWHPDKLARALKWHETVSAAVPNLYGGRTRLVDSASGVIGYSPLFSRKPTFSNALVQSIMGGNTMVMNRAARALWLKTPYGADIVAQDWWSYILVSGAGGNVYYDPVPVLDYRQHDTNAVGANVGWRARLIRLSGLASGRFRKWTDKLTSVLGEIQDDVLTPENGKIFLDFQKVHSGRVFVRLRGARMSAIHRQTRVGNIGLWFAVWLKKI
jgi:glycosyltransferase involved in cell wall biosynthesis